MAARWTASRNDGPRALSALKRSGIYGLRIVVALVFCYAGLPKMRDPRAFADTFLTVASRTTLARHRT